MSASRILFTPRNLAEFLLCDRKLQEIIVWLSTQWPPSSMEIGDIHRTPAENAEAEAKTNIHVVGPPYRAIDVKVRLLSDDPQAAADALGALVNARYVYDPARPSLLVAVTVPHGTGPHIHLQTSASTGLKA